jgi:hypothetical protein
MKFGRLAITRLSLKKPLGRTPGGKFRNEEQKSHYLKSSLRLLRKTRNIPEPSSFVRSFVLWTMTTTRAKDSSNNKSQAPTGVLV